VEDEKAMKKKRKVNYNKLVINRLKISIWIFIILMIYIIYRLGDLMVVKHEEYSNMAKRQQFKEEIIMPTRGTIYDSGGKELAVSIPIYDYWIELTRVPKDDKGKDEVIDKIASAVPDVDRKKLKEKLNLKEDRTILLQNVSLDHMKKLREKDIPNTWFDEKSRREYPYGNFASYVLGHTSGNNVGLAGIEASMDLQLKGIPGKKVYVKDANGQNISVKDKEYQKEINGKNVMLTIDEVLQHNMERALRNAYVEYTPKSVSGILMETKTGNILAMSTVPDYNPNLPREAAYDYYANLMKEAPSEEEKMKIIYKMWRNPSVNNIFEPGSPFKLFTSATALEEGKVSSEEYFVDNGYIEVAGQKLKNWTPRPFGTITFKRAIEQSVNTVFVQLGQRLGGEMLLNYVHAFGFGQTTNINLPGEEPGSVRPLSTLGPMELANMSYGQGIAVTPIQLITAVNAIGNGGKLVEPNIVKALLDEENNVISKTQTKTVKQVISSQTSATLLNLMESVVNNGSGKKARIDGYRIAGKTGSANKVVEGEKAYSATKFICTFVAIAPVEDPQITLLIVIDEPREGTQSGSESAAPIARNVLEGTLKYLGINQNVKIDENNSQKTLQVPELKNMSYTQATEMLQSMNLVPTFEQGVVVEEKSHVVSSFPSAGEMVEPRSKVMLYMASDTKTSMTMPNLIGMTKEQAQVLLDNLELKYNFTGSGKVFNQNTKSGALVDKNFRVTVDLK